MSNEISNIIKNVLLIATPSLLTIIIYLLSQKYKDKFILVSLVMVFIILAVMVIYLMAKADNTMDKSLSHIVEKLNRNEAGTSDFGIAKNELTQEFLISELELTKNNLAKKNKLLFEEYINRALELFLNASYPDCVSYLIKSKKLSNPYWIDLFIGHIYFLQQEYNSALEYFTDAYNTEKNPITHLALGNIYFMLAKYGKSVKYYNRALGFDIDATVYYNLAITYASENDFNSAKFYYQKALSINKERIPILFNLANLYLNLKEFSEAKKYYEKVFNMNYSVYGINNYYTWGLFYHRQSKIENAIKEYENSISNFPKDHRAYVNLTNIYNKIGKYESAIKVILKSPERDYRFYAALGNSYFFTQKYRLAIENYQESLKLNQKDVFSIYDKLFKAYNQLGEKKHAEKIYLQAITDGYKNHELLFNLAHYYETENDCVSSAKYYAMDIKNHSLEVSYINISRLLLRCSREEEALHYLKEGVKKFPESSQLYNNYAIYYLHRDDLNNAKKFFEISLKFDPNNKSAKSNLNRVLTEINAS